MTKQEWENVFAKVYAKAGDDYFRSDKFSKEETSSYICMKFAEYMLNALKDDE